MKLIKKNAPAGAEYVRFVRMDDRVNMMFSKSDNDGNAMEFIDGEWLHIPGRDIGYLETSADWHPLDRDIPWWLWFIYGAAMAWTAFVFLGVV